MPDIRPRSMEFDNRAGGNDQPPHIEEEEAPKKTNYWGSAATSLGSIWNYTKKKANEVQNIKSEDVIQATKSTWNETKKVTTKGIDNSKKYLDDKGVTAWVKKAAVKTEYGAKAVAAPLKDAGKSLN